MLHIAHQNQALDMYEKNEAEIEVCEIETT